MSSFSKAPSCILQQQVAKVIAVVVAVPAVAAVVAVVVPAVSVADVVAVVAPAVVVAVGQLSSSHRPKK